MSSYFSVFKRTGTDRLERFGEDLLAALLYPFQSALRALLAVILGALTFVVLILASQSMGVLQMFMRSPEIVVTSAYVEDMFLINFETTIAHYGWMPIVMNALYAVLTGIALTNMVAQLRMLQMGSLANIGGILPGLFAAGCASCGPGLFALFGFTGAIAFIPFQGTVLRLGGLGMFLFFLGLSGDPRECRID
ncbi:hypothetical protein [Halocatena marina]|uniref:Yip1 domain-containing protein n=1 Tax=Halocatena marina TaxID=2934937 RepID=A0ABD5YQI1_9EURY|nr:hypothetical protein [Halocatena marina]